MLVQRIPVDQINPAPYNPRVDLRPGDAEYEKLQRSIETFGCVEPLVWNRRTGILVGGHQRFKILIAQGCREADVSVVDLSPEQERVLNVALNKIQGDWDLPKLARLHLRVGQAPNANAYAEAWVGSLKRECLDYFLCFGFRHLDHIAQSYVAFHNAHRPHKRLGNRTLAAANAR